MQKDVEATAEGSVLSGKLKDYYQLMKFTLSFTVVFSSVVSYLLVPGVSFSIVSVLLLFAGGLLVTGSANAINQVSEKDTDAMMKRTSSRPVAAGRMSVDEAWTFALVTGVAGIFILGYWFNWTAAALSAFSLFLYGFIYTPLKKVHSIAVLVGAIPGALPCLIGWVAGADTFSAGGWILFALQFFWQFPHFWAIAWVAYADYSKAGFRLLPSTGGPTKYAAVQAILYSVILIPIGVMPYVFGMSGAVSLVIVAAANLFMLWQCIRLYREMDVRAARRVMFSSYIYLPVVLLALLADKAG
ncbi:MAG: heme o synthase [Chitinophagaceae bacterium]|jgi:protoheme IX farnesyltransferase|nr:heme o synthase [Chitinophagaceae bacterium]